ncbi:MULTISPECIES: ABC transporter ATP-binding protein [Haloarcula]|uniref:ABC-type D-xylose/L-arabinose transporter n=1 Tax=Haloarcula pellucida TaxID=1427151 RepID=A0A830GIM8_9EURY|nr:MULTISPECIES: ABC transporter ATP-binding protein [Halomicroarcula]MBX0347485.1 ABC transporter ATP-binding protein [Halomicroarcula pellucida]MDS0276640.1 ABC transporter ATP-binding protein [Halomicroarcula sp. S1AR25-4]GGN88891.1 ABC transporter ATP-binding protein [Halomicroarcula pellucida]
MAGLTLDNVTKIFDDDGEEIVAVDDVSIDIDDGEFLVLVGPSGCGKSTTLRMIAGLEEISEGEIRLGETVMNDIPPTKRNVAMVFQSYALYPHMTVRENMAFGLEESTDMPDDEIDMRVEEAAELLGIPELLERPPSDLSGGQQQRVALGRAIVRDPEVFLMDEPLANLDAKLRAEMRTELQQLQEDLGVTTVYVTHNQVEAMTMSDRVAILNDGILQQCATPLECYHQPNNLFVAGFIGEPSMNFFDAERQGSTLVTDDFEYELSEETISSLGGETDLVFGIRPEDVTLKSAVESNHDYRTVVDVVEPMGDENVVHLVFEGNEVSEDDLFTAVLDGMKSVDAKQNLVAEFPEEAIHLFDRKSGEALRNRELEAAESPPVR